MLISVLSMILAMDSELHSSFIKWPVKDKVDERSHGTDSDTLVFPVNPMDAKVGAEGALC